MASRRNTFSINETHPEDLLIKIISFLDFKEAIRTSMVSRSWRHLWKYIPNIVLDEPNVLSLVKGHEKLRPNHISAEITQQFIDGSNFILQSHRGQLEFLEINFFLDGRHATYLDEWISCAISSRAKMLLLDLRSQHTTHEYNFPCHLLSSKECLIGFLELKFCTLKIPSIQSFDCVRNLKTLQLESVHVTDRAIQDFLPKCAAIENLSLESCNLLVDLRIPTSLSTLKVFNVGYCKNLTRLECYAPKLSAFIYGGHQVSLKIQVLEIACIESHSSYVIDHLPQTIASVKTLDLVMAAAKARNIPRFYGRSFINLRHLELLFIQEVCTSSTIINAAPFLETLVVRIWGAIFESESINDRTIPNCPHNHLKLVTLVGFTGYHSQFELVRFLLENATQLEAMTIETSMRYSKSGSKLEVSPLVIELERKKFYELLRPQAPQHVKLSVL